MLGGSGNDATGDGSTVLGGFDSTASGGHSAVFGGWGNNASAPGSTVSGGSYNKATGYYSLVAGGEKNEARGHFSLAAGGGENVVTGDRNSTLGGRAVESEERFEERVLESEDRIVLLERNSPFTCSQRKGCKSNKKFTFAKRVIMKKEVTVQGEFCAWEQCVAE